MIKEVKITEPSKTPIDGWTRIHLAHNRKIKELPSIMLSVTDSKKVVIR